MLKHVEALERRGRGEEEVEDAKVGRVDLPVRKTKNVVREGGLTDEETGE